MLKKLFLTLLPCTLLFFLNPGEAKAQGWTFTESVSHTGPGPCIPYPMLPPITYGTKEACEYNRQQELNNNGDDWSLYGDGSCLLVIVCGPCVGGGGPAPSGSGGSTSELGAPGAVSLEGLLSGLPYFSAHESKKVEDLLNAYIQKMKSMGVIVDKNTLLSAGEVPLTGDSGFDRYWVEQLLKLTTFGHGTAVNLTEKEGIVDPKELNTVGKTVKAEPKESSVVTYKTVPVMGNTPMTQEDIERQRLIKQFGHTYIDQSTYFINSENNSIDKTGTAHPYVDLGKAAVIIGVGLAAPEIATFAAAALLVNAGAEIIKGQLDYNAGNTPVDNVTFLKNIAQNTALDVALTAVGAAGEVRIAALTKAQVDGVAKLPARYGEAITKGIKGGLVGIDIDDALEVVGKDVLTLWKQLTEVPKD